MKTRTPPITRLKDYRPAAFRIVETRLTVELDFSETRIRAWHRVETRAETDAPLRLDMDGDMVKLEKIAINGAVLTADQYQIDGDALVIPDIPAAFELTIENTTPPDQNTALSGLYRSGDMLCTQCEAEGYRRITPAIDRPDNLSRYTVTLRADKKQFPVLLCNGNLIEQGTDDTGNTHYAIWQDPFPKPTYLFAIVAGALAGREDKFITRSGRAITLRFYARPQDIDQCAYGMEALKRAMAWDEEVYGREYDLDLFNVVAVSDFNMGAMENKSLNIFNTAYVLAHPTTATDDDFANVEGVIGHEYFHNWSGNRVTCRDWFQLSLKEGFTVFRDQQFSADMGSHAVKRIEDVAVLRSHQFREDAGPMAHPVRPDSYSEINNFYTVTVYNKGAEVVRMLHTLLGAEKFRAGTDLYFDRHDGQAVTTDDFVAAMESAGSLDLTAFKNWYSQAGTPVVEVETSYDDARGVFTIALHQHCPPTPDQPHKKPFVIPIKMALFDRAGKRLHTNAAEQDELLVLEQSRQSFTFATPIHPVASLLRGFSAPVVLRQPLSEDELALLLAHDDDPFNRWEAAQKLFLEHLLAPQKLASQQEARAPDSIVRACESVLDETGADSDPALQAEILTLPSEAYIGEAYISKQGGVIDPAAIHHARHALKRNLAAALKPKLLERYHQLTLTNDGSIDAQQIANRSLRDTCLAYLSTLDDPDIHQLAVALHENAHCMTDSVAALVALSHSSSHDSQALLDDFYRRWRDEPLVVDKWLRIQATAPHPETLARVESLTHHESFDSTNPNKVYALLLGFSHANPICFHARDGSGYHFIRHWIEQLDPRNPQISARLTAAFINWKKYIPELSTSMRQTLEDIAKLPNLSNDTAEIVNKSLKFPHDKGG